MNRTLRSFWALCGILGLVACASAPATRVILLPEPDGKASAVDVSAPNGRQLLSTPYQTAEVGKGGDVKAAQTSAEEVAKQYGRLLALRPAPEVRFLLYFLPGTSRLTPESEQQISDIADQASKRSGGEILVIGHTDRAGTVESNDALSLQRARHVQEIFVQKGFPPGLIEAVGRGEREPLVPTEDEVNEPRNRRAEIVIR